MRRNIYEDKLNRLIHKYKIDKHNRMFWDSERAKSIIRRDFFKNERIKNLVILYENKGDYKYFISLIPEDISYRGVQYINNEYNDIYSLTRDSMKIDNNEICVLVSYDDVDRISVHLAGEKIPHINIYSLLENKGIYCNNSFCKIRGGVDFDKFGNKSTDVCDFNWYIQLYIDKQQYMIQKNEDNKKRYLEKIIFDCYLIKDFWQGEKYIKEYFRRYKDINQKDVNRVLGFQNEVRELLKDIKKVISSKEKKDIVLYWIDAVSEGNSDGMDYINCMDNKAFCYKNAVGVSNVTRSELDALISQNIPLKSEASINKKEIKEGIVFDILKENNYSFSYYGFVEFMEEKYRGTVFQDEEAMISSQNIFDMMCDIAIDRKPGLRLCHLMNGHEPFLSGRLEGNRIHRHIAGQGGELYHNMPDREKKQREDALKYLDVLIEKYDQIITTDATIYFSDHGIGQVNSKLPSMVHLIMKIKSKKVDVGYTEKALSICSFYKIIKALIEEKHCGKDIMESFATDKAIIQLLPIYSERLTTRTIQQKLLSSSCLGYSGIVNGKYTYIRIYPDVDLCYIKEENNYYLQGYNESKKIIENIKKENTIEEIDLSMEKFVYSRKLYEIYNNGLKRVNLEKQRKSIWKAIDALFENEERCYVRGGGEDAVMILDSLSMENKGKIIAVVDNNKHCQAARLGIPVLTIDEWYKQLENKSYAKIIVASSTYGEKIKNELQDFLNCKKKNYSVIDVYEYINGLGFEKGLSLADLIFGKRINLVNEDYKI